MNQRAQFIRALAIIAVVAIHTPAPAPYVVFIRPFLNPAVALFLFLSAYLTISHASHGLQTGYGDMVRKRFSRLLPPYAIWVFLTALPALLFTGSFRAFASSLFWTSWGVPFYFFVVYFQLMLLQPWIARLAASRYWSIGFAITPLALAGRYALHLHDINLPSMSCAIPFPIWFGYYYLGIVLGMRMPSCQGRMGSQLLLWVFTIILQMAEGCAWWYLGDSLNMATSQLKLTSLISSSATCLLAYAYISQQAPPALQSIGARFLLFTGNVSMGIFLCHILILRILHIFMAKMGISLPWPLPTLIVLLASLLLILACNMILPTRSVRLLGFDSGKKLTVKK